MKLVLITALAALCLFVGTVSSNYYYGSYYPYNQNQGSGGWLGSKTFCFVGFITSRVALIVESIAQGRHVSIVYLTLCWHAPGWLSVCLSVILECVDLLSGRRTCVLGTLLFFVLVFFWGHTNAVSGFVLNVVMLTQYMQLLQSLTFFKYSMM